MYGESSEQISLQFYTFLTLWSSCACLQLSVYRLPVYGIFFSLSQITEDWKVCLFSPWNLILINLYILLQKLILETSTILGVSTLVDNHSEGGRGITGFIYPPPLFTVNRRIPGSSPFAIHCEQRKARNGCFQFISCPIASHAVALLTSEYGKRGSARTVQVFSWQWSIDCHIG